MSQSTVEGRPPSPSSPLLGDNEQPQRVNTQNSIVASPTSSPSPSPPPARQNTGQTTQTGPNPRRNSTLDTFASSQSQQNPQVATLPLPDQARKPSETYYLQRLRNAFEPSTHDLKEYTVLPPEKTGRPYYHQQQKWRLWRKTIGEFIITLILCLLYFVVLYTFHMSEALDRAHRRWFNALVTGIALCLGVNLSASLRSYAKMLRWRMLASKFRSLKNFDLIMGCDSTWNVIKLIRTGRSKHNRFPLNSLVQLYAIAWLIVQIGIAVSVGIIGLTYNLNVSSNFVFTQTGNTSVLNVQSVQTGAFYHDAAAINVWGVKGDGYGDIPSPTLAQSDQLGSNVLSDGQGHARYWFIDAAANNFQETAVSYRYIDAITTCTKHDVTSGSYGNSSTITYIKAGKHINTTIYGQPGPAGLYVQGDTSETCGPRCTRLVTFLAAVPPDDAAFFNSLPYIVDIPVATLFECNTTVPDIHTTQYSGYPTEAQPAYRIEELTSRLLAGAYAWSDNFAESNRYLYQIYTYANEVALGYIPTADGMADVVSAFVVSAVEAMDRATLADPFSSGVQRIFITDGNQPIEAQVLDVKWWAAGTLLAVIPFVQFWLTVIVIAIANKTVIKDDAHIAIAKLYHSLLQKLGTHGCILDGDQLVDALGNPRVVYAYSEVSTSMRHVDVYEEDSGIKIDRCFPEGDYDGTGGGLEATHHRRKHPTFDAYEYF